MAAYAHTVGDIVYPFKDLRAGGLSLTHAAYRLNYLLNEASSRQLSGVELKDESNGQAELLREERNFLIDN